MRVQLYKIKKINSIHEQSEPWLWLAQRRYWGEDLEHSDEVEQIRKVTLTEEIPGRYYLQVHDT